MEEKLRSECVIKEAAFLESADEIEPGYKILLDQDLADDPIVLQAAKSIGCSIVYSRDCESNNNEPEGIIIRVVATFDYLDSHGDNERILGKTALLEWAQNRDKISTSNLIHPLFCTSMSGLIICVTGFRKKSEITVLKELVQHMGGNLVLCRDMFSSVTHLVAKTCGSKKYFYAATFRVPIVCESWVYDAWEKRDEIGFTAADPSFIEEHKRKPFHGARICFLGFASEEKAHMIEVLVANGGQDTNLADPTCTHLVVDESVINKIPPLPSSSIHVVRAEWFWASVQNEGRVQENEYRIKEASNEDEEETMPTRRNSSPTESSTLSGSTRKRKRLKDRFPSIDSEFSFGHSGHKRRSSASEATRLSNGSFLDYTNNSAVTTIPEEPESIKGDKSEKRYCAFSELCQTESNYVGILEAIIKLFKLPLEAMPPECQLLNATELKIIFGFVPPIYEVHSKMLAELLSMKSQWSNDKSIGKVILSRTDQLVAAYPPFINYFEDTREMLIKCDKTNPRFHAFLKIGQSKPECARQSLQELLIRPVQRLPSICLLLNEILKYTQKSNPDHEALSSAICRIQGVMTHINEDKRRTEGQVRLFDIFHEIDNCPPQLVSSQRYFIGKCDAVELSDNLSGRGHHLTLFLFSDVMEVCKRRVKANKSPKEAGSTNSLKHSNGKLYKHIKLLQLPCIKRVIDIKETEDCQNIFALTYRNSMDNDTREKIYSFTIGDEAINKDKYLRSICKQISNITRCDLNEILESVEAQALDIESRDVTLGTLGRAIKFASKTGLKVGRALSFNKTPSKIKRAVTSIMSPFAPNGGLTPSSQLSNLQLAPLATFNDLGSAYLYARRNKSSSFTFGSQRKLQ